MGVYVKDIVSYVDRVYPNPVETELKCSLLRELDLRIKNEVFDTHEGEERTVPPVYHMSTELLAGEAYSAMYRYYLLSEISLILGQGVRYQNYALLYNGVYSELAAGHNRANTPRHSAGVLTFR